ncbi:SH3 domain-containing protein [Pseudobdellovibrio sp. HCB154]|uniref:SH3 domain-containing protein n=1 Tax=Pseudobdellovibrio sp. HCB154 TaxID=3386277 RepID=UPI00391721C0
MSLQCVFAQNKAHVLNADTDVYGSADFDSATIGTVDPDETFLVSKKTYGEFYKVKFKDGTIGYIPDTDVYIEGVGTVKETPFRGDDLDKKAKRAKREEDEEALEDDTENPNINYKGVTFSLINFHEETMGGNQVADLQAFGFRFQPMQGNYQSGLAYDLMVAPKAPDYYEEKTGAKTSGAVFWGSAGISNVSALNSNTSFRYGAGPFLRYSYFTIKDAPLRPQSTYNLQDLTVGLDFQAGIMLHSRYVTIDLGLRYFWDKESYGGFGVAFLF